MRLENLEFILPFIVTIPLVVSLILFFIRNYFLSYLITIITTFSVFFLSLYLLIQSRFIPIKYYFGNFLAPYGIEYKADALNLYFIIIVSFIAFVISIYQKKSIEIETNLKKTHLYNSIFLLVLTGSLGILITNDAFNLFVFLEILSLSTYILMAINRDDRSFLNAFNYLIIGTVAASFYVFGIGILYVILGTLNIEDIINKLYAYQPTNLLYFAIAMVATGVLIKIGLFPLFFWRPNSYKSLSSPALALIGGTSFKVMIYVFFKIVILMIGKNQFFDVSIILNIIIILSIINILYGSLIIFQQTDLKLLLAFSSIAHVGYIMLGIGAFNQLSISASFYQILVHSLSKTGLFLVIGMLLMSFNTFNINSLKGSLKNHVFLLIPFIYFGLSLVGMPGTAGFWGKFSLIFSLINSQFNFIVIIILISSMMAFTYTWKLIFNLYGYKETHIVEKKQNISWYMYISIYLLMIVDFTFALNPNIPFYFVNQIISFVIIPQG